MEFYHKTLAEGRWFRLSFLEQMANIGSEVGRAINWKNKCESEYSKKAIERALELLCLTIQDPKNRSHLKELTRLKEFLIDYFYFDNTYNFCDEFWHKYFYAFNYAVSKKK
ncbi:MAG: hypothetical protein NC918_06650 [Candidatus Omnitrophica bacterium]|nr:hypothetical protein [Candidatus Omnitrophota bacterium]